MELKELKKGGGGERVAQTQNITVGREERGWLEGFYQGVRGRERDFCTESEPNYPMLFLQRKKHYPFSEGTELFEIW